MKTLSIFSILVLISSAHAADGRIGTAGSFTTLSIGGSPTAFVKDVVGGNVAADVVQEIGRNDVFVKKHVANVKVEDIQMKISPSMDKSIAAWIQDSFNRNHVRKNGAIVNCDFNGNAVSQKEFLDSLITEISFPDLDATSKEAGYLNLKVSPERTVQSPASGKCLSGVRQKNWLTQNFRLELSGLDTSKVVKIESFSMKVKLSTDTTGDGRTPNREPLRPDFSNLKVTISDASLKTWLDWYESFLVQGQVGDQFEKSGVIVLLENDLKTEIARIKLDNVGMIRMTSVSTSADAIARTQFELYVEKMEFTPVK